MREQITIRVECEGGRPDVGVDQHAAAAEAVVLDRGHVAGGVGHGDELARDVVVDGRRSAVRLGHCRGLTEGVDMTCRRVVVRVGDENVIAVPRGRGDPTPGLRH